MEIKPVTVISKEQLESLGPEVYKGYTFLEQRIQSSQLILLNPLLAELQKFNKYKDLKYDTTSEETIEKSIESYKAYKADLRSFSGKLEAAKKKIKGPLDEAGKMIVSLEKSCLAFKDSIVKELEKNFDSYEKEKEQKKLQAIEKRDAEKNQAIEKLTDESNRNLQMANKGQLINKLKFESSEAVNQRVQLALTNFTSEKISDLISELQNQTHWADVIKNIDLSILTPEEVDECKTRFESQIKFFIDSLSTRKQALDLTLNNKVVQAAGEILSGTSQINSVAPVYSDSERRIITPVPISGGPRAIPVPIQVPVPVQVREEILKPDSYLTFKQEVIDFHLQTENSLITMYHNYKKLINENSTEEEKLLLQTIHGAVVLAKRSREWINSKLIPNAAATAPANS